MRYKVLWILVDGTVSESFDRNISISNQKIMLLFYWTETQILEIFTLDVVRPTKACPMAILEKSQRKKGTIFDFQPHF